MNCVKHNLDDGILEMVLDVVLGLIMGSQRLHIEVI